jgi:hypothetical protein
MRVYVARSEDVPAVADADSLRERSFTPVA